MNEDGLKVVAIAQAYSRGGYNYYGVFVYESRKAKDGEYYFYKSHQVEEIVPKSGLTKRVFVAAKEYAHANGLLFIPNVRHRDSVSRWLTKLMEGQLSCTLA